LNMLLALSPYIENAAPVFVFYDYNITVRESVAIRAGQPVYFGEKKIGTIQSVAQKDTLTILGKMEIDKQFNLYSNIDFFFIQLPDNTTRIEARIDPTREKKLFAGDDVILFLSSK
ncbi:MAG TPA: hypothetical protein VF476_17755, partial [Chitinophagaceae bacterium]